MADGNAGAPDSQGVATLQLVRYGLTLHLREGYKNNRSKAARIHPLQANRR